MSTVTKQGVEGNAYISNRESSSLIGESLKLLKGIHAGIPASPVYASRRCSGYVWPPEWCMCRPSGTIAKVNCMSEALIGDIFKIVRRHAPPAKVYPRG